MTDPQPTWLTARDAASRLGVSRAELYRLIDDGRLPAYRIRRSIRLLVADVEEYLRQEGAAE